MKFNIKKTWWSPKDVTLVTKAIRFAALRYGMKNLELNVKLGKPSKKYDGFSAHDDDLGFKIWIYPGDALIRTIFHEMTHVKQTWYGELDLNAPGAPRWKGKKCKAKYRNQPWEIEARKMEKVLYKEWKRMVDVAQ